MVCGSSAGVAAFLSQPQLSFSLSGLFGPFLPLVQMFSSPVTAAQVTRAGEYIIFIVAGLLVQTLFFGE